MKPLKLCDQRSVSRGAVRVLREIIKQIDDGYVTGVSIATVRRDGTAFTYSKSECPIRALGAVDLLKEYIRKVELKPD
jgi:hypothetical protein